MSAASLARRRDRCFAMRSVNSCRAFSFSFRAFLAFFWVAANCSSALDFTDFNISVMLCCGSRRHGRALSSRSAGGSARRLARKIRYGCAHRAVSYCSLYFMLSKARRRIGPLVSFVTSQSLKVASPTGRGDRPQRELKAVPYVVIRRRTGSRRKICLAVRAEAHRRPSALR